MQRVEAALTKVTGRLWNIRVESGGEDAAGAAAPDNGDSASLSTARRQRLEAAQKPLVKKVMERMGAQILDMEEGFGAGAPADRGPMDESEEA